MANDLLGVDGDVPAGRIEVEVTQQFGRDVDGQTAVYGLGSEQSPDSGPRAIAEIEECIDVRLDLGHPVLVAMLLEATRAKINLKPASFQVLAVVLDGEGAGFGENRDTCRVPCGETR